MPTDQWSAWIRVRRYGTGVGRIAPALGGWVALDDRHGERRVSHHATADAARAAIFLRIDRTPKQLDAEVEDIVSKLREIAGLKRELQGPVDPDRIAEVLARANEIGRSW